MIPPIVETTPHPDQEHADEVLLEKLRSQAGIIEQQAREIEGLKQRVDYLCRQLYGSKAERFDPNQLQLPLGDGADANPPDAAPPATGDAPVERPRAAKPRNQRLRKSMEKLPVIQERLVPMEVQANPDAYRKIREEVTERLECKPAEYRRRQLIREIYQRRDDSLCPPVIAPMPPALLEGSVLSASLLADLLDNKYCRHLPFYRQEWILRHAHGLEISRNMLCHWHGKGAELLEPLYKLLLERLRACRYLQGDETPVNFLDPGGGKARKGYFWAIHNPAVGVAYQWHAGRSRKCLEELLYGKGSSRFRGHLQCDAYRVYQSLAGLEKTIVLVACLAHIRRKFHDALPYQPRQAAWVLKQIRRLYAIETGLRENGASHQERAAARGKRSRPIWRGLKKAFTGMRRQAGVLPTSPLGRALEYALGQWDLLAAYLDNGELEIDNNLVENCMRPLKLGAKNWLFIGREDTGWRTAVVLTLVENVRRQGYSPRAYLEWVFERLPGMTNQDDLAPLLPDAWIARQKAGEAGACAA